MTDEPKTPPPDSSDTKASESDDTSRPAEAAPTAKPKPSNAPPNETPEEKKARLERTIAEAKAKKEAAAAAQSEGGGQTKAVGAEPTTDATTADAERAAKI